MFKFKKNIKFFVAIITIALSIANINSTTQEIHKTTPKKQELNSLVKIIHTLVDDINNTIQEIEKINPIKLKNLLILGVLKNFKNSIGIADLQKLKTLENVLNKNTLVEIIKFIVELINNKSESNETEIQLNQIKNKIINTFNLNEKTSTPNFDKIIKNPTIQKIFNAAKTNPENLKNLLSDIVEKIFSNNSKVKKELMNIITKINLLF